MNEKKNIINYLIEKNNFTKYLEIGVDNPIGNFDLIQSPIKHSVDPCIEFIDAIVDYKYPSDDFFSLLENNQLNLSSDYKWDVIFIDGLHISTQVERDFNNALNHLSENGFILFHDTNPPTLWHAREEYYVNGYQQHWNGTVWKVIYKLNSLRSDLIIHTVGGVGSTFNTIEDGLYDDLGWGLSIIHRGSQECCKFDNPFYEYKKFEENRKRYLNIISLEEFYQIY
tara:strand:- start:99 stop:776 length:678 start_codon:yes stop_codon:yes gene_type:complete